MAGSYDEIMLGLDELQRGKIWGSALNGKPLNDPKLRDRVRRLNELRNRSRGPERAGAFSITNFSLARSTNRGSALVTIDVDDVGEIFADFVFEANRAPRLKLKRLVLLDEVECAIIDAITARIEAEC